MLETMIVHHLIIVSRRLHPTEHHNPLWEPRRIAICEPYEPWKVDLNPILVTPACAFVLGPIQDSALAHELRRRNLNGNRAYRNWIRKVIDLLYLIPHHAAEEPSDCRRTHTVKPER